MQNNQILLKEIIQAEFNESGLYKKEDDFFEFFSPSQVLKNYNLSDEEIADGITDGGLDGGCDAAYLFLNGDLLTMDQIPTLNAPKGSSLNFIVFQSKNTTSFKEDTIMKWKTLSNNLFDMSKSLHDFEDRYSERVLEKFQML